MKRQNLFAGIALGLAMLLGLMQFALPLCHAQNPWSRIELAGGGVAEDIQYLCHNDPAAANNEVWSACMDAGLYRAEWSETAWGDWIEYLPGRGMLGVDAIEVNGVTYALGGANSRGVWYGTGSPPPQAVWDRPNGDPIYPDLWNEVRILDVAFYRNGNGNFENIPQEYFAMLYGPPPTGVNPGIYKWTGVSPWFERIDAAQPTDPARYFSRFCRELDGAGHPDVLYALLRAGESPVYDGGLYKLQGTTYAGVSCSEVLITDDQNNYNIKDVYGFSQWKQDANTFWSYLLARWNDGSDDHVSVFYTDALPADDTPTWDKSPNYDAYFDLTGGGAQDWTEYGVLGSGGMVGRPAEAGHNLWIAPVPTQYGMLYDNTAAHNPIQVNGTHPTDLKRWHIHSMTPDYDHMESVGSDGMVAFVGTHKQGVWRFQHAPGSVAQWQRLGGGYYGVDLRDIKIMPNDTPNPDILAPAFGYGLFLKQGAGEFQPIGIPCLNELNWHPQFDKDITRGIQFNSDYYFVATPRHDIVLDPLEHIYHGGMYKIANGGGETVKLSLGLPNGDENYAYADLEKVPPTGTATHMYLTTGFHGADQNYQNIPDRNVVLQYDGSSWTQIFTVMWNELSSEYSNLGFLACEPDPLNMTGAFYLGLGNEYYDCYPTYTFAGRIEYIDGGIRQWREPSTGGYDDQSVVDISAMSDPIYTSPQKQITFWATTLVSSTEHAAQPNGGIYWRKWNGGSYDIQSIYPTDHRFGSITFQFDPACFALKCYASSNSVVVLVAAVYGWRLPSEVIGDDPPNQTHVVAFRTRGLLSQGSWSYLGPTPVENGVNIFVWPSRRIEIDGPNGYDIYLGGQGGCYKMNNDFLISPALTQRTTTTRATSPTSGGIWRMGMCCM